MYCGISSDGPGTNANDSADSSDSDAAPKNSSPELPSTAVSRINTSTFTRPKHGAGKRGAVLQYNSELQKRKTSLSPTPSPRDTPSPCDVSPGVDSPPVHRENGNGVGDHNGNENDGGAPMWHRLADVEDVQVMARMQEESKWSISVITRHNLISSHLLVVLNWPTSVEPSKYCGNTNSETLAIKLSFPAYML